MRDLAAPGTYQPGERNDLAGADGEAHLLEHAGLGQLFDPQQLLAGSAVRRCQGLGVELREIAADDETDDRAGIDLGRGPGGDVATVAQHRHRVDKALELLEPMRDQDDRDTAGGEPPGDAEHALGLGWGKRGRGLVEDQRPVHAVCHGARELDELGLADRKAGHRRRRLDRHVDLGQELPCPLVHATPVDGAQPGQRLKAHEDVLGHVEVREQLGVLVHGHDAMCPRRHRRGEAHTLAVEPYLTRVGLLDAGDDAHERALAGAVLAQDSVDRARGDGEGHALERADAAEALADTVEGEAWGHAVRGQARSTTTPTSAAARRMPESVSSLSGIPSRA